MSTLYDVAKYAGVSIATVSRTLSNQMVVHPDTRARVMDAIEKLEYIPNSLAQGLASKRSYVLGLIIPDIINPFFSYVARGCEDSCRARNYDLAIYSVDSQEQEETGFYRLLRARHVDGLILANTVVSGEALPQFIHDIPRVYVDHASSITEDDCICVENRAGAQMVAEYLLENGHRHMAIVSGFPNSFAGAARLEGFKSTLTDHGFELPDEFIVKGGFDPSEGVKAADFLMTLDSPPTAIFASNDMLAIGVLRGLQSMGYKVPADVSLVGFGDLPIGEFVSPSLTTVFVDKFELGAQAVDLLLSRIEQPSAEPQKISLPVRLKVRESSGVRYGF
ncbi:MAG: LacI family DNA-binding transcriptional regulator [Anaerolineaceae bacterium]|nr:LacI family DNA-binding transcriptional regulator [Anaerolineaceae bacterium]